MAFEVSVINRDLNKTVEDLKKLTEVATYLATSEHFVKDFIIKDEKGQPVIDEVTGKPKVNITDITLCLMAGHELGLNITGSLLYGKKMNEQTYMAAMKGRTLGLDITTSIEKIISIPTKNGYVSYTMVDIISAKLIQGGVTFLPFIKNYAPFYIYKDNKGNELDLDVVLDEQDNLRDGYSVIDATITATNTLEKIQDAVEAAKSSGRTIITRERHGYYSKIKMTRTFPDGKTLTMFQRFSTLDAERAGLLPTYTVPDKDGKYEVINKGKDNWISNTPQMMNNRCISIPGRIIGADLINGLYTREELVDAGVIDDKNAPTIDTNVEVLH